jgi:hypothetical protein
MKKTILIVLALIWISCLIILIIALTDIVPNNPFKDYRYIVGIGFIAISGFIRMAYRRLFKTV